MSWPLKVQGRWIHEEDVDEIRGLLAEHTEWGRSRLSVELCHRWRWRRADGQMKDMACRELLRKLERRNLIILPSRQRASQPGLPAIRRVEIDQTPVVGDWGTVSPVTVSDARASADDERLFNDLLHRFHYLRFGRTVGQNMKYLIRSGDGRILGCLLFGSAAWKAADRDRAIGWDHPTREQNLHRVTNNSRFLLLPQVRVKDLASHVLGQIVRRVGRDWAQRYGSDVVLLETFVDRSRFLGTCYKAANWRYVGRTKGRTRQDRYSRMRVPIKDIYLYPLRRDWRKVLTSKGKTECGRPPTRGGLYGRRKRLYQRPSGAAEFCCV